MKKLICLLLAVVLIVCGLAACGSKENPDTAASDLAYVQGKGTLVVGVTVYEPMNYKAEDGTWLGFDTEYAQAVAEKLGVEAEFVIIDWDNKYTELDAKSIDCIWNGMTITEEGRLNADISDPYVENAQVVVMAKDKLASYPDAESMKELTFAVETGSAGEKEAANAGFENVVVVADQSTALLEAASGSADACIIDITMADAMTGEGTSYADFGYSVRLAPEEYGIAFRKGSDLVAKVNEITDELLADGTLDALAEEYGGLKIIK